MNILATCVAILSTLSASPIEVRPTGEWKFNMGVGIGPVVFRADVVDKEGDFRFRPKGISLVRFRSGNFKNNEVEMDGMMSVGAVTFKGTLADDKFTGSWTTKSGAQRGQWSASKATPRIEMTPAERTEEFGKLLNSINQRYIFFKDKKLNIDDLTKKYTDRLKTVTTDKEYYSAVKALINDLNDGHASIVSNPTSGYPGRAPFEVRYAEGKVVVRKLRVPEAETEVRVGDILLEIDGKTTQDALNAAIKDRSFPVEAARIQRAAQSLGGGEADVVVKLRVMRGGEEKTISFKRLEAEPNAADASAVPFKDLGNGIGFIRVESFLPSDVGRNFSTAVDEAIKAKSKGIIIDMRANGGGSLGNVQSMTSRLLTKPGTGTAIWGRTPEGEFVENGPPMLKRVSPPSDEKDFYTGKIAILVDELSFSATECFSVAFRENNLGKIFGRTTGGGSGAVTFHTLRDEAVVSFGQAEVRGAGGTRIEGTGVAPDFHVPLTIDEVLGKNDKTLKAAQDWIERELKGSSVFGKAA